ncbi:hypothetical protein ASESINO_114 [Erwinia phage vB_EamM_Asesino]|uniref:Uncharacterized protein n=1 Tax=Erwinia phage vB_EamM_Asesino TaxID=1883370 RepID=A0A1B2IA31_9CAUD|nr:hypothetical protein ASESINO_114 [Erwinia phage vB_EamM_Asesino]ANZ48127.1 hypothetical protein ASESINO_114 [Erwinia phage vB_EamM_Asesino]
MSEMILDSLFLITITDINKSGKLPRTVCISRHGFTRSYHLSSVLKIACTVTGMKRPSQTCSINHVLMILQRAISTIRRKRRRASFRFYPNSTNKVVGGNMDNVVDLREATCNVRGLAFNRLHAVLHETDRVPTPQEGKAALELLRQAELVIVDTNIQAVRIQHYLAKQALLALCVTGEQASELTLPEVPVWGDPQVDHQ